MYLKSRDRLSHDCTWKMHQKRLLSVMEGDLSNFLVNNYLFIDPLNLAQVIWGLNKGKLIAVLRPEIFSRAFREKSLGSQRRTLESHQELSDDLGLFEIQKATFEKERNIQTFSKTFGIFCVYSLNTIQHVELVQILADEKRRGIGRKREERVYQIATHANNWVLDR